AHPRRARGARRRRGVHLRRAPAVRRSGEPSAGRDGHAAARTGDRGAAARDARRGRRRLRRQRTEARMSPLRLVLRAGLRDLARDKWLLAYGAVLLLITEALFFFGGTGEQVVLSLLNAMLLLVPLVALTFGTMHVYASREFVELLLAQPLPRRSVFAGLYLGLALPLAGAFL